MIAYVDEYGNISSDPQEAGIREEIDPDEIEVSIPKSTSDANDDKVQTGIVSFYNVTKGFGFIRISGTQNDVFFHMKELLEPVKENNKVSFELGKGPKGLFAFNIQVLRE